MKKIKLLTLLISIFYCSALLGQSYLGITTRKVNFREGPSEDYEIIKKLQPGSQLFLYSLDTDNDYYFVIDVETNEEGYVHQKYTKIIQEVKRNEQGIFTPIEETSVYNPSIEIFNNTSRTLTLKLNNTRYTFNSYERKILELSPGVYDYYASAPLVIPDYGSEKLQSNYSYSWEFYIVTRFSPGYRKRR
jgi:hypothetical protein